MDLSSYKPRVVDQKLKTYLGTFGAVLIEGPKWCGKTWTGKHACKSEFLVADLRGNFNNRRIAQMDPSFVLDGPAPRLIDEWQEVPPLWDAVRMAVDERAKLGQFVLTGSATIDRNAYIHTGTGRIARLKMRPMSLFESGHSSGKVSLQDICLGKAKNQLTGEVSLDHLLDLLLVGGWPSTLNAVPKNGILIPREYIKAVTEEDIYKVDGVRRDAHKIELLLRSLARNEATTATNATLRKDILEKDHNDVNADTIADYLDLLRRLYLLENIPSFSPSFRSSLRIKQSEKRHFVDPSLACACLGLNKAKLLGDMEFFGFLFESLVERDLLTYVDAFEGKLYHYQDYKNHEMDAVIELEDGSWCGIEIKLGAHQIEAAAANLLKINQDIQDSGGKPARSLCVICGLSNAAYLRPDGVYVVPITSLKE